MTNLRVVSLLLATSIQTCSATDGPSREKIDQHDLGVFPIGAVLSVEDAKIFKTTDCLNQPYLLADCSGIDHAGRRYTIYDSAVSVVSAKSDEASAIGVLPFGLLFGEAIDGAARKIEGELSVSMSLGSTVDGRTVYTADFAATSGAGIPFSVVLVADSSGLLAEYMERTDF